ncbi:hypothetical protein LCGC14_2796600 [marine sediment metagenome]|uniref:Uncharacterized protein n=1 Tax=marine sediment metagenome TaxID=412755 RepID=A0A0F8YP08_9ZZZZ
MAANRTIRLKGTGLRKERVVKAASTITPGMLIDTEAAGVIEHAGAGLNAAPLFAVENEVVGKGIDDDYIAAENCIYEAMQLGTEVHALLAANAAAIVEGDFLQSAGDGTLRILTASAATAESARRSTVARALEAVDNSANGSIVRIIVEVV